MLDIGSLRVPDLRAVTRGLSIVAVAAGYGVLFGEDGLARCPQHDDDRPSMSWFTGDDGKQRVKCHACGWGGDVIDLVRSFQEMTFPTALSFCQSLLDEGLTYEAPETPRADPETSARWAHACADAHSRLQPELLAQIVPAEAVSWVSKAFWLGHTGDGTLVMPHVSPAGAVEAVKIRARDGGKRSMPGSRLRNLYGIWHWQELPERVVLCEGESDTWVVSWLLRGRGIAVLGLPRGVASAIESEWVEQLDHRTVDLLFDGDAPGRRGMARWQAEIGDKTDCRALVLPDGQDARSAPSGDVLALLDQATRRWPL